MKFDFKTVHRPVKYYETADAMSRLLQNASDKTKEVADVDDDIPTYFDLEQISAPNTCSKEKEDGIGQLPTIEKLIEAQTNAMLC